MLFLDEPTVGLDPRIRHELLDVIAGLREREEMTIVLTTHYLDEAERLCDRVAIIHDGEIVALDTPAALLAGLGGELLELRVDGDVAVALAALARARRRDGRRLRRRLDADRPAARRDRRPRRSPPSTEAASRGASATTPRPTLDDVYLRLTGDGPRRGRLNHERKDQPMATTIARPAALAPPRAARAHAARPRAARRSPRAARRSPLTTRARSPCRC